MQAPPDNSELPCRQNPSPGVHVKLGEDNLVLLTVTTKNRVAWLANESTHRWIHETWSEATAWMVGDYLLMPEHLHVFCAPHDPKLSIEDWITYWKSIFAKKHRQAGWRFQSRGWHHRLRNGESYSQKWRYVQENPVRKGLCERVEDWPYKGTVFNLISTG